MRKFGTIAFCLLLCCTLLPAQIRLVPSEKLREFDSPVLCADSSALLFERRVLDAPAMSEDSAPLCLEFPFRNVSDREILITRAVSSCPCVRLPQFAGGEMLLSPGQEMVLMAVYDPSGHPGRFRRRISLYTSASDEHPAVLLTINAEVAWKSGPEGEYPFRCGSLRLRRDSFEVGPDAETVHIPCLNAGNLPLTITAESAFVPFSLSFRCSPETIAPGQKAMLIVETQAGDCPSGTYPLILKGSGARPSESRIMIKKSSEK